MMYARVAVNVPSVAGVFDYEVHSALEARVGVGSLVVVPFGKQTVQGVILSFVDTPAVPKTRPLADVLDPDPVLTPAQIALAESVAESTLSPLAAVVELMLPAGLGKQADTLYELRQPEPQDLNQIQKRIVKLLRERGPLRGRQIDRHFSQVDWRRTAHVLVRRGVLSTQSVLPVPSVRPKLIRTARLAASPEVVQAALPELGKTAATRQRRRAVLDFLSRAGVPVNVAWVYAESGAKFPDLQELAERDLIELREAEIWRDPLEKLENIGLSASPPVELTDEQRQAWSRIESGFDELAAGRVIAPFLLHGVTGSGKTELYQRAAQEALRRGKQALILVPEIALTPQTVRRFLARFPGQVGIVHSKLSEGERFDTWRRARAGLLKVVIGPRSALFAPLKNLGLIVMDECHDSSYYQSEPPFYHAVDAAQAYARLAGALCILGSATPSTQQRYAAETGKTRLLELPRRIQISGGVQKFSELPPVSIVDMREELKSGERGIFSRLLTEELTQTLKRGEQAILFLNRRGTATYVFCRQCGYVLKCPRCDTPLTFHVEAKERLLCHHCGYERQKPRKCPQCSSDQIREYGLGSEKVESEVSAMFSKARTLRWDWETTRQKDAHEIILSHFAAYRADVLVGTQMLAKGLDLPLVTLVGIVLADVGLNLPDPFAAERVFQVLTQVAGRAGRSERGGQVILQTFEPENRVIQAAARHDFAGFYADELVQRRQLGYPPFGRLVRLEMRDQDAARAEAAARQLAGKLQKWIESEDRKETNIIGPVPCFFSRLAGSYRWQVVVRGPDPVALLRGRAPEGWRIEVDPPSLL